ncbi:universal stress protein [Halalkalicoccus tibetensis]|uniref:Universal stress protein n=1 Tax=Halalkalicoccus tibetensis TaxID=175632 RepID=A0ABD5VBG4_9EURY
MSALIAIDGSDPARKALEHAFSEHSDEELTVLHVLSPTESASIGEARMYVDRDEVMENQRERAEELFEEAEELAATRGATIETETTVGRPDRAIVDYARDHDVDHVILGSHGRSGVSRVLLGSVRKSTGFSSQAERAAFC